MTLKTCTVQDITTSHLYVISMGGYPFIEHYQESDQLQPSQTSGWPRVNNSTGATGHFYVMTAHHKSKSTPILDNVQPLEIIILNPEPWCRVQGWVFALLVQWLSMDCLASFICHTQGTPSTPTTTADELTPAW